MNNLAKTMLGIWLVLMGGSFILAPFLSMMGEEAIKSGKEQIEKEREKVEEFRKILAEKWERDHELEEFVLKAEKELEEQERELDKFKMWGSDNAKLQVILVLVGVMMTAVGVRTIAKKSGNKEIMIAIVIDLIFTFLYWDETKKGGQGVLEFTTIMTILEVLALLWLWRESKNQKAEQA